jgi:hypothetical protein
MISNFSRRTPIPGWWAGGGIYRPTPLSGRAARRLLPLTLLLACSSCSDFYFARGTIGGACDPPRLTMTDFGATPQQLRMSNCQPMASTCCRVSSQATRTTCQYPEDCYVAPLGGSCGTPVDCADTQSCVNGTCQCTLGGPPCPNPTTKVVTCCSAGNACVAGMCTQAASDGGV